MASRLFSSALKGTVRRSLGSQLIRPFATETNFSQPIWRSTVLPNGLTVATESNPFMQTATVGVWINAGSRAETAENNGAAHFLEHMAFKGTKSRSQHQLELFIENIGAHLNAYTSREQTVYYAKAIKGDVPVAVEILADIIQNSTLEETAIKRERDVILREQEEVDKLHEEVVFDHLHATAFQGHSLGRTILGPKENILSLKRGDLVNYIAENYTADRMVLVGTGGIDHEELVKLAEKHFSGLSGKSSDPSIAKHGEAPKFTGSEVRIRNDELPQAHIAIAVEGVGWTSPDYYPLLVAQSIIGTWDRSLGSAPNLSSRLSYFIHKHKLANSFQAFHTSYSDTGLFGIYLISENKKQLDDLVHFTCKEFWRLYTSVTGAEVERAKQQLKTSLLLCLDGTTAIAEDIGRQLITTGKRLTPEDVDVTLSKITVDDIRRVAGKYLWDQDVAIVGLGPVEGMPDYNRTRGDMSTDLF